MPPRRDGIPAIVDVYGRVQHLERLALGEREISEDWLQQRLFESPQLLPIDDIDPGFGPLVPIGREISTPAGPLDYLFISPRGLLTLVEAKLWRNPQARREVVGQILDYAKELSRWSYDDLDARARECSGKSLWRLVSACGERLEEPRFVDAVCRNLRAGRFLLLIVGDGIREEMERLAEFLQSTPQLRFTLALVELQLYRLGHDGGLLVMPVVVGRTSEVVRAVVRVASSETAQVDVSLELANDPVEETSPRRRVLSYDEFFQELAGAKISPAGLAAARKIYEDFEADARYQIDWRASSFSIKLRDPVETGQAYTILLVERSGSVYIGWLGRQLLHVGLPAELGYQFAQDTGALVGRPVHKKIKDSWDRSASLDEVAKIYPTLKLRIEALALEVYRLRQAEQV